ncbi:MAG: SulP family inorganic anion transporter [Bacteroidetes bacterium]|nr:MAG: SulP family inorganic anion transporter [Bacteroidota bacterium]
MKNIFQYWKNDLPSSLVVFLVALPLCLGVGLASTNVEGIAGMPSIFSGLIAGIVGGIIVGAFSGSRLGVSGPAAGLITIITGALLTLGSFEAFLVAVFISGVIQLIAGFIGAGVLSRYFPSSVIKGMLAAIGITLILKEIPHAVGYDKDFFGDESFWQMDGHNTFSELLYALNAFSPGATVVSLISITLLIILDSKFFKRFLVFKFVPSALIVVIVGVLLNEAFKVFSPSLIVGKEHLVNLPVASSVQEFTSFFHVPDFSYLTNPDVYVIALTLALVGSLETLLSVEATDKLDPDKHHTPTNRELKAQGIGNIVSGLIGGLPITQVIVRSSANINSGAKSKLSAILHGVLLLFAVLLIPGLLNKIPLSSLAAILLMIGYKLAKLPLFRSMFKLGNEQFLPFIITIIGVLLTDLLIGIAIGMSVSIFYILRKNFHNNYKYLKSEESGKTIHTIKLSEEVTFLNKASIFELLDGIEDNAKVVIEGSHCEEIDYDAREILKEFKEYTAKERNIDLEIIGLNI